jgi:hypothetical protein
VVVVGATGVVVEPVTGRFVGPADVPAVVRTGEPAVG